MWSVSVFEKVYFQGCQVGRLSHHCWRQRPSLRKTQTLFPHHLVGLKSAKWKHVLFQSLLSICVCPKCPASHFTAYQFLKWLHQQAGYSFTMDNVYCRSLQYKNSFSLQLFWVESETTANNRIHAKVLYRNSKCVNVVLFTFNTYCIYIWYKLAVCINQNTCSNMFPTFIYIYTVHVLHHFDRTRSSRILCSLLNPTC